MLVKTHMQPNRDYSNTEIDHLQTRLALRQPFYSPHLESYHIKWQHHGSRFDNLCKSINMATAVVEVAPLETDMADV